jgi:exosortase D (VPLPA-CTERM-specific)
MTLSSSDGKLTFPLGLVPVVLFFLGISLLVVAFAHPLSVVIGYWQQPEYSHAFLLPPIAALIAWHRLIEKDVAPTPSWGGLPMLILGILLLVVGEFSTFYVIALYGFIIALMGLCATMFGFAVLSATLPAFICLFFAVPLPQLIFVALSAQMQLLSSTLGVMVLDALSVPVFQEGNVIDLGGIQLQVADACSGLRYLFPLMSFAFLVAYLYRDVAWKRLIIFLSSIPLTIGMNSLRIALIGVTVDRWGIAMAQGLIHELEGWTIFLVCALLLMLEMYLLRMIGRPGWFRVHYLSLPRGTSFAARAPVGLPGMAAIGLSVALMLIASSGALSKRAVSIPPHASLTGFPIALGDWVGVLAPLEPSMLAALKLTDYWSANYAEPQENESVNLYIAYYARQDLDDSIHSPSNCVPAGGWQVVSSAGYTVDRDAGRIPLRVTRMLIQRGQNVALIYYWFNERGRDITNQYAAKWYLLLDAITMNRSDGSLIRLVTTVDPKDDPKEGVAKADRRLQSFLAAATPALDGYL